jgi:FkbM family methyltransferase
MLSQHVSNALTDSTRDRMVDRWLHKALHRVRQYSLRLGDPHVKYVWGAHELLLPFSHQLPHYRATFPLYSENVGRIARHVKDAYPDTTVIDIGANVGDTVACIRNHADVPILCIEGDRTFLPLLEHNVSRIGDDIEIAPCYVGPPVHGIVESRDGTARIQPTAAGEPLAMRTLQSILVEHPRFAFPKLVKIDTDGFDCRIIRQELAFLASLRAVVFFEFDPSLTERAGDTVDGLFTELAEAGFGDALVYDNLGNFLLALETQNAEAFADLRSYFERSTGQPYADICVFHESDSVLFQKIRSAERLIDVR